VRTGEADEIYVSVAVPIPPRRLFTYRVRPGSGPTIDRGARVRVPFGRRHVVGTVVECPVPPPEPGIEVRDIAGPAEGEPRLDDDLLDLTRFVADYYLCSWGEAIETALPAQPGPARTRRLVRRLPGADPETLPARAVARRRVLKSLPADGALVPAGRLGDAGRRVIPALVELGLVEVVEQPWRRPARGPEAERAPELKLTPEQTEVVGRLTAAATRRAYAPFLLYGATGSGKTEVYLRAAEAVLADGRDVLYLVPEIGLTPLLVERIARRFEGSLAVLHSALGRRERYESWRRVARGEARFVLGTRSAVFAPIGNLGLIVVDEEQDGSYKQDETPRYNGRDLAVLRAREASAVVVLGSATPSLESFHQTQTSRYGLLRLGGRIDGRSLPDVEIVDMRDEYREAGEVRPVSRRLLEALAGAVARGEQAMVLRNRRGWATALFCPTCGERMNCPRCTIAMTWHQAERRLRCHYCEFETRRPEQCPKCGGGEIRMLGEGAERIEDELRRALPEARIERMDRDTVRRRGAHEALLRRFDSGEIDVLVGTQMIAKGHDFPRVTVVGVLSADQTLGLPDFRAAERTFQLLTQIAGRAGRGDRPGRVIVQAFDPDHPVLREAAAQDFEAFYQREILYRRALRYPPLTALVEILIVDRSEVRARGWAERVAEVLREEGEGRLLFAGPGPAPIERLRGLYRQQILVRTAGRRRLVTAVDGALERVEGDVPRRAIQVDVDPLSLL
jgi:primosomal protein N' (replication factor Y)